MRRAGTGRAWLAGLLLVLAAAAAQAGAGGVTIGSKDFTEAVVLGEVARQAIERQDVAVVHRRSLGGTRILWRALLAGEIDAYPEYTGTLVHELLRDVPAGAPIAALRERLALLGIGITGSLGFDNGYAIGMREEQAAALDIERLSALAGYPELRIAVSNEFLDRGDGWPGLRAAYGLPQAARGMDHALAYRALAAGAIDAIDLYTTDAEIASYHLRVLADDRGYFPRYEAVFLYRLDLESRQPRAVATLQALAGTIDVATMRAMNGAVRIDGDSEARVAARLFGGAPVVPADDGRWRALWKNTVEHLALVGVSLSLAIALAVPLGILAARRRRLGQLVLGLAGILQTVPSLALFVFMIPLFGIGAEPAIAALFLYSLLPIVRNVHAGLAGIAPSLLESAAALGLPPRTRLWRVELPLALRSILAGVKIAAVINVGTATLGALIGAGGYGQPILTGIRLDDIGLIMQGAVPAAVLALAMQGVFEAIERLLTPRGLRLRART